MSKRIKIHDYNLNITKREKIILEACVLNSLGEVLLKDNIEKSVLDELLILAHKFREF